MSDGGAVLGPAGGSCQNRAGRACCILTVDAVSTVHCGYGLCTFSHLIWAMGMR